VICIEVLNPFGITDYSQGIMQCLGKQLYGLMVSVVVQSNVFLWAVDKLCCQDRLYIAILSNNINIELYKLNVCLGSRRNNLLAQFVECRSRRLAMAPLIFVHGGSRELRHKTLEWDKLFQLLQHGANERTNERTSSAGPVKRTQGGLHDYEAKCQFRSAKRYSKRKSYRLLFSL
jgi:hypothetical protein